MIIQHFYSGNQPNANVHHVEIFSWIPECSDGNLSGSGLNMSTSLLQDPSFTFTKPNIISYSSTTSVVSSSELTSAPPIFLL